jgi:methyltransferase (TIGR00027 family)
MKVKNNHPNASNLMIRILQILLYIPMQIVFIPFALIGLAHGLYKEMVNSKKLGVSFSAGQSLQYRWIMHYFNTRPDPLTIGFTRKFPCESHFGLWTIMGALILSQRWFGFTTKLGKVVEPGKETFDTTAGRRVIEFDNIMEKYIGDMEQIVLPGAGFDLIAQKYTDGTRIKVFEIDQANTIKTKVDTLKKAGIKHDWISFVPVDYSKESWSDKLLAAGFDKTKKTLFLWQSVSLYLDEKTVKDTLRQMADMCVEGSVIAQDFYSQSFASGEISDVVKKNSSLIGKMGEPWIFGIDMSGEPKAAINEFLHDCGLRMTEYNQFGEKTGIEPFYCIVEAEKL